MGLDTLLEKQGDLMIWSISKILRSVVEHAIITIIHAIITLIRTSSKHKYISPRTSNHKSSQNDKKLAGCGN